MYQGLSVIEGFENWNDWFNKEKKISLGDLPQNVEYHQNMGVVLKSPVYVDLPKTKEHGIVKGDSVLWLKKYAPCGIKPLNTEQTIALELLNDNSIPLVTMLGSAGSGKAQPVDALVLTPNGYTTMGNIKVGDLVIGKNGKSAQVLKVFPQGKKDIYKITFSDGTSTECCAEHLWWVKEEKDYNNKEWKVVNTEFIKNNLNRNNNNDNFRKNIRIPQTEPVEFTLQNRNIIDPYLMGVLLGDATFRHCLVLSTGDEEIVESVNNCLSSYKMHLQHASKYDYRIIHDIKPSWKEGNFLQEELKKCGLWNLNSKEKFIPESYKISSVTDRISLIQGLMDTDGTVSKSGKHCYLSTSSAQMCEDFKFICESLGCIVVVSTRVPKYPYKEECKVGALNYRISVRFPKNIIPFRLKRKIDKFSPKEKYFPTRFVDSVELVGKKEAKCILVNNEDHTYLTNNFIVTHNTLLACAHAMQRLRKGDIDKIVIAKSLTPVGREIGFLKGTMEEKVLPWLGPFLDNFEKCGVTRLDLEKMIADEKVEISPITFIQGRSISNSIIIVDEIQNLDMDVIKQVITRAAENCKILLLGDPSQRFERGSLNLEAFVDKGKLSELVGHIYFRKSVRSPIAEWAVNNL